MKSLVSFIAVLVSAGVIFFGIFVVADGFICGNEANAEEVARIYNFAAPLLDMKGSELHEGDAASPVLTLGSAIALALNQPPHQDQRDPRQTSAGLAIASARRSMLALRILGSAQGALTAEEIVTIKDAISIFSPIVAFRVLSVIDPAALN